MKVLIALLLLGAASGAQAAAPLAYGLAFGAVRPCTITVCTGATTIQSQVAADFDLNPVVDFSVDGRGSVFASGQPGSTAFDLPILRARAIGQSEAHLTSVVRAFQGYRNNGSTPFDISFAGSLDWVRSSATFGGFITAGLAILSDRVAEPDIGPLWLAGQNTGLFTANCATPGAIAVVETGILNTPGSQTASLDTANGMCGGGSLYTVAPGETFYVHARLLAFTASTGASSIDASNTFRIDISPNTPIDSVNLINQHLVTRSFTVPEPSSWAMLIIGFGGIGARLRPRRHHGLRSLAVQPA